MEIAPRDFYEQRVALLVAQASPAAPVSNAGSWERIQGPDLSAPLWLRDTALPAICAPKRQLDPPTAHMAGVIGKQTIKSANGFGTLLDAIGAHPTPHHLSSVEYGRIDICA